MRAIVDRKGFDNRAASTSQMGRFETEWLATGENLAVLTNFSGVWIDRVHDPRPPKMIILDMDSSVGPGEHVVFVARAPVPERPSIG
jgi:hypothetical protein